MVDGIVTEDSDAFVFGGRKGKPSLGRLRLTVLLSDQAYPSTLVYKNFFDEQKYCEAYYAIDIERDLALKKHQFVALAMLLGGDYTDGVKGVGIGKDATHSNSPVNHSYSLTILFVDQ